MTVLLLSSFTLLLRSLVIKSNYLRHFDVSGHFSCFNWNSHSKSHWHHFKTFWSINSVQSATLSLSVFRIVWGDTFCRANMKTNKQSVILEGIKRFIFWLQQIERQNDTSWHHSAVCADTDCTLLSRGYTAQAADEARHSRLWARGSV